MRMDHDCPCEYVDVGIGMVLADPYWDCPVHTFPVLTAMTLERHESEKRMGLTPARTHWAHRGCPCGCGPTGLEWVQRNEDKPHRCPRCHGIRHWDHFGPRTTVRCRPCGVRWKMGRGNRWSKNKDHRLNRDMREVSA